MSNHQSGPQAITVLVKRAAEFNKKKKGDSHDQSNGHIHRNIVRHHPVERTDFKRAET
jgi:hypothetical protein